MLVFACETSCDETSLCLMKNNEIVEHIIFSQEIHRKYGGVVPELASRSHLEKLQEMTNILFKKPNIKPDEIDIFCATCGPGLIGSLLVGSTFTKALSISFKKPFVPINHLEGHILSTSFNNKILYPHLVLLLTGGHTQIYLMKSSKEVKILGTSVDDALGEAFDKTAKLLGIEFPGGPQIEILARKGDPDKFKLPLPIINKGGCNLSFAGLKTAVLKIAKNINNDDDKYDLAASFQQTIEKIIYKKSKVAIEQYKKMVGTKNSKFVIAGGVAANKNIRKMLINLCKEEKFDAIFPPTEFCGDNASMIAIAGLEKFKLKQFNNLDFPAQPRWVLDDKAPFLKGAGIKI